MNNEAKEAGKLQEASPPSLTSEQKEVLNIVAFSSALGVVVHMMVQSGHFQHQFLSDLTWRVYPPIMNNQFHIPTKDGKPAGYLSWAMLTPQVLGRLSNQKLILKPEEWTCGDQLVMIDCVLPGGDSLEHLKAFAAKVDPEQRMVVPRGVHPISLADFIREHEERLSRVGK